MHSRKNRKPIVAMAVLAAAALTLAAMTFTNVTYWLINATLPPVMKYAGADVNIGGGEYVKVSYYFDPNSGLNITRISVIGFTGDPTEYSEVIKICNSKSYDINAQLQYVGPVGTTGYEQYVHTFIVYWAGSSPSQGAGFMGGTQYPQSIVTAVPANGGCRSVSVRILIDPTLPATARDGKTILATYQVNIVMSAS